MIKKINNLGDAAVYCDFGDEINIKTNSEVLKFFKSIKNSNILGITNIAPSYNKLIITFDLDKTNFLKIKKEIQNIEAKENKKNKINTIKIPV